MSFYLKNFPHFNDKECTLENRVEGEDIVIRNSDGWEVTRINMNINRAVLLNYLGAEIRVRLVEAQRAGYAQAQADIRKALGIEENA